MLKTGLMASKKLLLALQYLCERSVCAFKYKEQNNSDIFNPKQGVLKISSSTVKNQQLITHLLCNHLS